MKRHIRKKVVDEFVELLRETAEDGVVDMLCWSSFIEQCLKLTATPKQLDDLGIE